MSQAYTNPLGVRMGPCTYCGFCEWFGCGNYSKASSADHHPAGARPQIELRGCARQCEVTRINLDGSGKRATGVTFVDTSGEEWEQPADLVMLSAFRCSTSSCCCFRESASPTIPSPNRRDRPQLHAIRRMSSVDGFFDNKKFNFNPFIASGAIGMCIDEFNGDNFDHGPHGFVGGGYLGQVQTNGRPIETTPVPTGTPRWGAKWKKAVRDNYLSTSEGRQRPWQLLQLPRHLSRSRSDLSRTASGVRSMRMTIDFHENELKTAAF